jgi:hypothetical protein
MTKQILTFIFLLVLVLTRSAIGIRMRFFSMLYILASSQGWRLAMYTAAKQPNSSSDSPWKFS